MEIVEHKDGGRYSKVSGSSFRVLYAYNSGKIENSEITYHDIREIFENGRVLSYTDSVRTLFEMQNQKICYEALKPGITDKEPLSLELVKEVHRILTNGTYDERMYIVNGERPGEFKKHEYKTGIFEVGSVAEKVEFDLSELIAEVNEFGVVDPMKAAAYFHARFERIHPFADGNGRVGRTLMNYLLLINDYPPLIVYVEDKTTYYKALQEYDESESLCGLVEFLKDQTVKTWDKAMKLTKFMPKTRKRLNEYLQ